MFRLVTADVAFYTGNLQALKGLKDLDLNMAEIWEQKRWWYAGEVGSSSDHGICTFMKKIRMPVMQELNLEPNVNCGGGRGKETISAGKLDPVGSPRNAILCILLWGVSDQVSNIFHSLWKQTQVSLDQIQKNT